MVEWRKKGRGGGAASGGTGQQTDKETGNAGMLELLE